MTVPFETVILIVTAAGVLQAVTLMLWRMETRALRERLALMNRQYARLRATSHRRDRRTGRLLPLGK
jgi:hypothetical protein